MALDVWVNVIMLVLYILMGMYLFRQNKARFGFNLATLIYCVFLAAILLSLFETIVGWEVPGFRWLR